MAESYSVEAILSAIDKGFTSTMQKAENSLHGIGNGATKSLGSIMNIASGIGVFRALDAAVSSVTSHLDSAIDRYDTLNQFPKVMEQMGYSTEEAEKAMSDLSDGITKVPTSLDTVVGVSKRIALLTGDLGKATSTTLALNNAMIASGSSSADAERGMTQYIQMLSKGKVDAQSWQTLQETMSYALGETAKQLGITSGNSMELYNALQSGKITFDEFNKALIECNEGTGGFAEVAVEASGGIKTAMSNMGIYITRGLANAMGAIDEMLEKNGFGKIETIITNSSERIITASDAIRTAIENISDVQGIIKGFGATLGASLGAAALMGAPAILSESAQAITMMGRASKESGKALIGSFGKMRSESAKLKPLLDKVGGSAKIMFDSGVQRGATIPTLFNNIGKSAKTMSNAIGDNLTKKLFEFYTVTGRFDGGGMWKVFDAIKAGMSQGTDAINMFIGRIPYVGPLLEGISTAAGTMASGTMKYFSILGKVATKAFVPAAIVGAILVGLGLAYKMFGSQMDNIISMVATKGPEIIQRLADSAMSQLPVLLQIGANVAYGIINAITANLPVLLTAGIDIISALVSGVGDSLPMLIPAAVTMIMTLVEGLAGNAGKIITAGLSLLRGLATGIANSMPIIAKKGPEIIKKLATAVIKNLPQIITTGFDILAKLAAGVVKAVPTLIGKIPGIISSMKRTFLSQDWGSVGKHIITGIIHGVTGAGGSLIGEMKSLASKLVSAAKSKLKIGSPSRVFKREVGKWIPIGMAKGVIAHTSYAVKATRRMADKVFAASGVDLLNGNDGLYGRYAVSTGYTTTSEVFANQNAEYHFHVTSEMDGREVAKGTATYTKKELEKKESREERKNGRR